MSVGEGIEELELSLGLDWRLSPRGREAGGLQDTNIVVSGWVGE